MTEKVRRDERSEPEASEARGSATGGRRPTKRGIILATAGAIFLSAGCDPGTRIEGSITIADGLEAPDDERHTLYIAAFRASDVVNGVLDTSAGPVFMEFGGITNDDFDPEVEYALGGAGAAEEVHVYVWWKIGRPEQSDYEIPSPGDRFGVAEDNPIFQGANGDDGDTQRGVDIELDRTFTTSTSG